TVPRLSLRRRTLRLRRQGRLHRGDDRVRPAPSCARRCRARYRRPLRPGRADAMKIAMIGAGYVGLVSGACFSEFGVTVTCVDKDAEKIARLHGGEIPIFEPGLDDLVARNAQAGRLAFASDLPAAVAGADAVFIAVGTPSRRGDGHADLTYVYAAAREIAHALTGYAVVVTKSTVPVGTGREVARIIHETNPQADFDV